MKKDYEIVEIERIEGVRYYDTHENQGVLSKWYKGIRDKKLSQLSDADLIRLVRQNVFLEYIIDECIIRLYKNPISGEKYSGEMIAVLTNRVESTFWKSNIECRKHMKGFTEYIRLENLIIENEDLDEFEVEEFLDLIKLLNKILDDN